MVRRARRCFALRPSAGTILKWSGIPGTPQGQGAVVARGIAAEIAENAAPVSVALTRQMLWRMLGADHPMEAHRADSRGILERGRSADAKEGVESFLEKRQAEDGMPCVCTCKTRRLAEAMTGLDKLFVKS